MAETIPTRLERAMLGTQRSGNLQTSLQEIKQAVVAGHGRRIGKSHQSIYGANANL